MFDVAYEVEATITAAEITKELIWQKILYMNLTKVMSCFCELLELSRMTNYITYYSIMYYTHGV